jgi:hypothetical protein
VRRRRGPFRVPARSPRRRRRREEGALARPQEGRRQETGSHTREVGRGEVFILKRVLLVRDGFQAKF